MSIRIYLVLHEMELMDLNHVQSSIVTVFVLYHVFVKLNNTVEENVDHVEVYHVNVN